MLVRLQDCFVEQRFGLPGPRRTAEQPILRRRIVELLLPRKRFVKIFDLVRALPPCGLGFGGHCRFRLKLWKVEVEISRDQGHFSRQRELSRAGTTYLAAECWLLVAPASRRRSCTMQEARNRRRDAGATTP